MRYSHVQESISRAFGAAKDNTAEDGAPNIKDGTPNPDTKKAQHPVLQDELFCSASIPFIPFIRRSGLLVEQSSRQ